MLKIRLQRVGRKNHAEFRVVATESTRGPKSANYLEKLGSYNPHTNSAVLADERIKHWIEKGAQVSDTVHNLLVREGVVKGEKKNVLPKKTPIVKEEAPEAPKATAPKADEATEKEEDTAAAPEGEQGVEEAPVEETADAPAEAPAETDTEKASA